MATSKFSVSRNSYKLRDGDLLILGWFDNKTPLFDKKYLPEDYLKISPPDKNDIDRNGLVLNSLVTANNIKSAIFTINFSKFKNRNDTSLFKREIKKIIYHSIAKAGEFSLKRVVVPINSNFNFLSSAVHEGAVLGGYKFDKYLSKKEKKAEVMLICDLPSAQFQNDNIIFEETNFARDTLNEPPEIINPKSLADLYKKRGTEKGLKVEVWDSSRLKAERCGGILAVGKGSLFSPALVIGRYTPKSSRKKIPHVALVGKGITFDSGGYSLKPTASMEEMKMDMGGAAMMFGAASAIAALKLQVKLSVFLPVAHNAISSKSYNVSDVIISRSGRTIEVMNTDAEGRLILADALTVASEEKPDYIIDAATLTGAAVVALGEDIAALYGTNRDFNQKLISASLAAGENMWEMPLHEDYGDQYKSNIADTKNTGTRWGGSIGAALFLKHFVKNTDNWIHVDIAGPGCKVDPLEHLGKGAKGFGVKSIVELVKQLS
ncbi:MAG: leucyl aminopeptidase family protein [Deltaproteobacteria bacterium]|nr:leucyl aminopeptidase family protein [Deltaproteobacteria bacterium]